MYLIVFTAGQFKTGFKKKAGAELTDIGVENMGRCQVIGNVNEHSDYLVETDE